MIAGLRGLGVPAAYVSGYLRTVPPPGKERLEGADATHAWVSVWCGTDDGWLGFDPTNAIDTGDDHIALAIGRDFSDVSPVYGVFVGSGANELRVEVDVIPLPRDKGGLNGNPDARSFVLTPWRDQAGLHAAFRVSGMRAGALFRECAV